MSGNVLVRDLDISEKTGFCFMSSNCHDLERLHAPGQIHVGRCRSAGGVATYQLVLLLGHRPELSTFSVGEGVRVINSDLLHYHLQVKVEVLDVVASWYLTVPLCNDLLDIVVHRDADSYVCFLRPLYDVSIDEVILCERGVVREPEPGKASDDK